MLMWNVLGARGVDVLVFESFGKGWANDIVNELKLENVNIIPPITVSCRYQQG